jgi:putative endonuclease
VSRDLDATGTVHGPTSANDGDDHGEGCDGRPSEDGRDTTTVRGQRAEDLALRHLERAGLELVTRNYRCRAGELDLVMLEPATRTLVIVEVRSRGRRDFGDAASTIGYAKQRRIVLAARHLLLTRRELRRLRARFDVVALDPPAGGHGQWAVTWIRGAWVSV